MASDIFSTYYSLSGFSSRPAFQLILFEPEKKCETEKVHTCLQPVSFINRKSKNMRRDIITLIALQAMTPNVIAENFNTTRQSVSKHLRILTECQLVKQEQ
jgi:predicted transcriptional regulator